jgi:hypothetical protein
VDRAVERRFLAEIETQCTFGLRAEQGLSVALAEEDTDGVWCALQMALLAAANISKLLWGSPRNPEEAKQLILERQALRGCLRTTKASPLHRRTVRNAFEHFDEKVARSAGARYASRTIGPQNVIPHGYRRFGHFDPASGLVTFGRECINIKAVFAEFARLKPLAATEFRKKL